MRVLLLFRGSPGCGKSTFIEQNGLKHFALSADDIRCLYSSPALLTNGETGISGNNEKIVWDTLFKILEHRMTNGDFCVIDATNSKTAEINRYKTLAKEYRYRMYIVDMTDLPIEECKRRNAQRPEVKRVPEEVIDKMYARFATQQIPAGVKTIKPDELDTIWYKPMDLSQYTQVHVIGDIHGCYTALMDYININGGIHKDEAYIFLGDYIDRGIENVEVVNWICEQAKYPNMIFLEGNHERWLWCWGNDVPSKSPEFERVTRLQLEKGNVDKKKVREFYRKLGQCAYFTHNGRTFLVTHGGLSCLPENLTKVQTYQMVRGVGNYSDAQIVDDSFAENTPDNVYQIHGHRNITKSPIQVNDKCFNLEGDIEFGGKLRAVRITQDDIIPCWVDNTVFKVVDLKPDEDQAPKNDSMFSTVENMRMDRNIYEKKFGRISSFNFTRDAFERGNWNEVTTKARGLYIDTEECKVVARSYDKFFNINERPETKLANLKLKLTFPATAYIKYNGFLGIVGWNPETDDLLITTKSSPTGDYARWLKEDLYRIYGEETVDKIRQYIKENDVSFVFECCDMERDAHIIEYPESKLVLLDIVQNSMNFEHLPYDELCKVAHDMCIEVKEKAFVLNEWADFFAWYNEVTGEDYTYNGENIEGFVIEDATGYMVKLKLYYYKMWKRLRGVAATTIRSGNYKYTGSLLTPIENDFFGYCKMLHSSMIPEDRKAFVSEFGNNICKLRKEFFKWRKEYRGDSVD